MLFVTYSLHQNSHISTFCFLVATTCRISSPTAYTTRWSSQPRHRIDVDALAAAVRLAGQWSKLGGGPN